MVDSSNKKRNTGPVVTPSLRKWLTVLLGLFALLLIDSVYLSAVDLVQWWTGERLEAGPYIWAFFAHLILGLLFTVPVIVYGIGHARRGYDRPNRHAVAMGWGVLITAIVLLVSGYLLMRVELGGGEFGINDPGARTVVFWTHVAAPCAVIWFFVLHRLVGRRLRWKQGVTIGGGALVVAAIAVAWHLAATTAVPPRTIKQYPVLATAVSNTEAFQPSLLETAHGGFIPREHLLAIDSCNVCHPDAHETWMSSVHRFSSFNNPLYLFSVRNTRKAMVERTGDLGPSRFCAGCHDPVVLLSGEFDLPKWDDPSFDAAGDEVGGAGINCIICHAVETAAVFGNGSITIADPTRYPFALSDSPFLKWVNHQLIRAKPSFHKRTFLKPLHQSPEFCGACHKVFLPEVLNGYKWLPGQNHYDTWRLSGVSGRGITAWYFPPTISPNCNGCHMPLMESAGLAAKHRDDSGALMVHHHGFHAGNPAIAMLVGDPKADRVLEDCERFNEDAIRVDLFALREGGRIDGALLGPLRTELPVLERGKKYLLETLTRTLKLGHPLTQGTADSNELWIKLSISTDGQQFAQSGHLDEHGIVDPWAKFLNVWLLDRDGNRIEQRNPEDIFVPLYNHQIPPGAADLTHYAFTVPDDAGASLRIEATVYYRKFDSRLIGHAYGDEAEEILKSIPILELAHDTVLLSVGSEPVGQPVQIVDIPLWQRWNDYGIGLIRNAGGMSKGQLRQAADAFREVAALGRVDGTVNLGRTLLKEGRIDEAAVAFASAADHPELQHPWTLDFYLAKIERERGALNEAIARLRRVRASKYPLAVERGYNFGRDDRVLVELATLLFESARVASKEERSLMLNEARELCDEALQMNPHRSSAWYALARVNEALGRTDDAAAALSQFELLRPDDNARDRAVLLARKKSPEANHAAEPIAIYDLDRVNEEAKNE